MKFFFFFLMFLCDHLGLYCNFFYIYNYEMMMRRMREWGRAVVGERGSVNPWQYLHRCFLMSLSISGSGFLLSASLPGPAPAACEGVVADRYAL